MSSKGPDNVSKDFDSNAFETGNIDDTIANLDAILADINATIETDKNDETAWIPFDDIPSMLPNSPHMSNSTTSSSFSSLSPGAPEIPFISENATASKDAEKRKNNSQNLAEGSEQSINEMDSNKIDKKVLLAIDSLQQLHQNLTDNALQNQAGIAKSTLDLSRRRLKRNGYLRIRGGGYIITKKGIDYMNNVREPDFANSGPASTINPHMLNSAPLTFQFDKNAKKRKNNNQSPIEEPKQSVSEQNVVDNAVLFAIDTLKIEHRKITNGNIESIVGIDEPTLNASKKRLMEKGYLSIKGKWWHIITKGGEEYMNRVREADILEKLNSKRRKTTL